MTAPPFRLYRTARCARCGKALPKDSLAVARGYHVYCPDVCRSIAGRAAARPEEDE